MAKSFMCRRTLQGMAVITGIIDHICRKLKSAEDQHGRNSRETLQACLIVGAMYCAVENYEKAEPLLQRYVSATKGKQTAHGNEIPWASSLLAEAYFKLNRFPEGLRVISEAKAISRRIDLTTKDPLLEAFLQLALSFEADGASESRLLGFVAALLTLCWCITHGLHRTSYGTQILEQLRVHFTSYGIGQEEWDWIVKHAHLTKYDYVGLLSVLLHHTGLAPSRLEPVIKRRLRVIEVR